MQPIIVIAPEKTTIEFPVGSGRGEEVFQPVDILVAMPVASGEGGSFEISLIELIQAYQRQEGLVVT